MAIEEKPPKKKKYLTNKELLREIEKSHEIGEMTPAFAKMIMMLTARYASRGEYINYSYNQDMQSVAILNIVKVWRSFDPAKSQNPFAYFTSAIKHSFWSTLNNEAKQRLIRDELLLANGDNPSAGFLDSDDNGGNEGYNYNIHIRNDLYEEEE